MNRFSFIASYINEIRFVEKEKKKKEKLLFDRGIRYNLLNFTFFIT